VGCRTAVVAAESKQDGSLIIWLILSFVAHLLRA